MEEPHAYWERLFVYMVNFLVFDQQTLKFTRVWIMNFIVIFLMRVYIHKLVT